MNCRVCRKGIMEEIGSVRLVKGNMKLDLNLFQRLKKDEDDLPTLIISICSNCGHVELEAVGESLSHLKKNLRKEMYQ